MLIVALRSFVKLIQELSHSAMMISNGNYDIEINSNQYDHEWQLLADALISPNIEEGKIIGYTAIRHDIRVMPTLRYQWEFLFITLNRQ